MLSGNNAYYTAGDIGLGLTAPLYQLHVRETAGARAIYAVNTSSGVGIYGQADAFLSTGVLGTSAGLLSKGVEGTSTGNNGYGVRGNGSGSGSSGVYGDSSGADSFGVYGNNAGTGSFGYGMFGRSDHPNDAFGVFGDASSTNANAYGVRGNAFVDSATADSFGVYGEASGSAPTTGNRYGVYGTASVATNSWAVFAAGDSGGTGMKHFVQPHPADPSQVIKFVCLEGNESGTYFRGTARLVNGKAEISIPDEWRLVTADGGITVQVTPIASFARLAVFEKSRDKIVVGGTEDCEFDYFVNGVRRGYTQYEAFADNKYFRPTVRGVPYGAQYPKEMRDILVQNGILNPDYTPNEQTAAERKWSLLDPTQVPIEQRWWLEPAVRAQLIEARKSQLLERVPVAEGGE